MYQISNESLTVFLTAKGAEIQSIMHTQTQLEYMWNADPAFWSKKSPVLFPIVGGLKNNTYEYAGKTYSLNRHGFARETVFTITKKTKNSITFALGYDKESLLVYPFHFKFSIQYDLEDNQLSVTYFVENVGNELMYFSVGAHPAFAVPVVPGTEFNDHYLKFNQLEASGKWPLSSAGLIEKEWTIFFENSDILPLTKELFYNDALVFKQINSSAISLLNHKNNHGLELSFENFPYLGIWSAKNADFVCIEPWCGIADSVNSSGNIVEKEGINSIPSNGMFTRKWRVRVF